MPARLRARGPDGAEQREELPHGRRRATRHPGGQRRPPAPARCAAPESRLVGRDRDECELRRNRRRDAARAAARRLRHQAPVRRHDAGRIRRGLSRRAVARHPRQRDPVHQRRGGEDRARDPEDARPRRRRARGACADHHQRARQSRGGGERPHGQPVGGVRHAGHGRGTGEKKTLERIQSILKTGKPLRN